MFLVETDMMIVKSVWTFKEPRIANFENKELGLNMQTIHTQFQDLL